MTSSSTRVLDAFTAIDYDTLAVGRQIGAGTNTVVYKAWHGDLGTVALKCLMPKNAAGSQLKLFLREAALLSRCRHSNIVKCYGVTKVTRQKAGELSRLKWTKTSRDSYAMVLEYCEGGPLLRLITESVMFRNADTYTNVDALNWMIDVAAALQFLQQQTPVIIHRDIKPANVLLARDFESGQVVAKLSDFGLHKLVRRNASNHQRSMNFSSSSSSVSGGSWRSAADIFSVIPEELEQSLEIAMRDTPSHRVASDSGGSSVFRGGSAAGPSLYSVLSTGSGSGTLGATPTVLHQQGAAGDPPPFHMQRSVSFEDVSDGALSPPGGTPSSSFSGATGAPGDPLVAGQAGQAAAAAGDMPRRVSVETSFGKRFRPHLATLVETGDGGSPRGSVSHGGGTAGGGTAVGRTAVGGTAVGGSPGRAPLQGSHGRAPAAAGGVTTEASPLHAAVARPPPAAVARPVIRLGPAPPTLPRIPSVDRPEPQENTAPTGSQARPIAEGAEAGSSSFRLALSLLRPSSVVRLQSQHVMLSNPRACPVGAGREAGSSSVGSAAAQISLQGGPVAEGMETGSTSVGRARFLPSHASPVTSQSQHSAMWTGSQRGPVAEGIKAGSGGGGRAATERMGPRAGPVAEGVEAGRISRAGPVAEGVEAGSSSVGRALWLPRPPSAARRPQLQDVTWIYNQAHPVAEGMEAGISGAGRASSLPAPLSLSPNVSLPASLSPRDGTALASPSAPPSAAATASAATAAATVAAATAAAAASTAVAASAVAAGATGVPRAASRPASRSVSGPLLTARSGGHIGTTSSGASVPLNSPPVPLTRPASGPLSRTSDPVVAYITPARAVASSSSSSSPTAAAAAAKAATAVPPASQWMTTPGDATPPEIRASVERRSGGGGATRSVSMQGSGALEVLPETAPRLTPTSSTGRTHDRLIGSPIYMAPEAFLKLPHNEKVDVYSLGVVMYELFSRTLLMFTVVGGQSRTLDRQSSEKFAAEVANGFRPDRPATIREDLLWELIQECWNEDPSLRPAADAIAARLDQIREDVLAKPTTSCTCTIA